MNIHKMMAVGATVITLSGCEMLGLQNHQGDIARLKYENGDCYVELWQSGLELVDADSFRFNETITIDTECNLDVKYDEIEQPEGE